MSTWNISVVWRIVIGLGAISGVPAQTDGLVTLPGDQPTRIDVGATQDYTAADGSVWLADRGFNNGRAVDRGNLTVTGTKDPALFRTERSGMVAYTFAIPNGVYTVRLHLAETDPAVTNAGQRLFNVDINGWLISSVDICGEAKDKNTAVIKSAIVEVTEGTLTLRFMQRKLSVKLDALEIIPEPGKQALPKPTARVVGRRLPNNTPVPVKHYVLEDFENTTDVDLHKKWNQWGELSYRLDPDNKHGGQYGVTQQVGKVNTSWFGYPPRLPVFSCAGMNAWRMWVKPDGSGRFATFFIKDGSQEVYCWCLPDLLVGTEPYILEVPLADYTYIFRENNQVFEPEGCAEFGYWITGPCTFSLDDIMLVHNPDLPDLPATASAVRPQLKAIELTQATNAVDVYDYLEVTVRPAETVQGNPFTDAALEGEFTFLKDEWTTVKDPKPVKVEGFCDSPDGSTYKIRFMPSRAGSYQYTVTLRQGEQAVSRSGTFTARRVWRRGLLRVDPKQPFHFMWDGTGEHYFWNGTTTYYLMGWQSDEVIRKVIDRLSDLKINRLRVLLYGRNEDRPWGQSVKSTEEFKLYLNPWVAQRPDNVKDPGFDLRRFNVAYWQRYERMLAYAKEKGMVISVIPFIGAQVLPTPFAAQSEEEQLYYRYAVARLAAFSNITWDLGNEHDLNRPAPQWADWLGPLVKQWDPYDHLLSAHNRIYRTAGNAWNNMQLIQRWDAGQNSFLVEQRRQQTASGRVVPLVLEEYGYEDLWEKKPGERNAESRRRVAWEVCMAGCYQTTGETANRGTGFPPDSGGGWVNGRGDDAMTMLQGYGHLVAFFAGLPWWRMEPRNDLVGAPALCLAGPGMVYAVYLPSSRQVTVKLEGPLSYRARWFNPCTGAWSKLADATGPQWTSPLPPGEGDWVLLLTTYDWSTSESKSYMNHDGLQYNNNRWAGERGSMFVRFGPPTATWWTTHEGPANPYFPVSAPWVTVGNDWGNVSKDSPFPIQLKDIETLKASWSMTLPPKKNEHMFRICWQLYFSDSPTARPNAGDFAPTIYAQNCSATWWGKDMGTHNIGGHNWKICDCAQSSGMGRYIVPLLDPYLTPDANGVIQVRDLDLKPLIDWLMARGYYDPNSYCQVVEAAWEVWVLDDILKTNDMSFTIKKKGQPAVTIPSWTTMTGTTPGSEQGR